MSEPSTGLRPRVWLVRHGETEWSRTGRHTGRTDVPLTERGREDAVLVGARIAGHVFERVLTSPLSRASETCRLAGYAHRAEVRDELREWDYGDYEGATTAAIHAQRPGWSLWRDGAPHGEAPQDVGRRADRLVEELRAATGDALVFSHGHLLRVLTARWLGLAPSEGRLFALDTAGIGVLGYEHEVAVISRWNDTSGRRVDTAGADRPADSARVAGEKGAR